MLAYYRHIYDHLHGLHDETRKVITNLADAALDWKPYPDANTINILVTHMTGAERFLIGNIVLGESSERNREAEFQATGLDSLTLIKRLSSADDYLEKAFQGLTLADLEKERQHPVSGQMVQVGWAITHALTHSAGHTGEIQVVGHWWEIRQAA